MKHFFKLKKYHYEIFLKRLRFREQLKVLGKKYVYAIRDFQSLEIGLTYRCQLRCNHCGIAGARDDTRTELSTADWKEVITAFHAQNKGYFIVFAGAEPLLRQDLFDLIDFSRRKGIIVGISTNGLLLNETKVRGLRETGVAFINISLDGSCADAHDANRNKKGVFKRAIDGFCLCREHEIPAIVSTCATKKAIASGQLELIIAKAREVRASGVRILFAVPSGTLDGCSGASFTVEEREHVRALLDPFFVYVEGVCNTFTECNALLKKLFYISPYGDVQPCSFVPRSFGNVREEPLASLLKKMSVHSLFRLSAGDCIMRNPASRLHL